MLLYSSVTLARDIFHLFNGDQSTKTKNSIGAASSRLVNPILSKITVSGNAGIASNQ